MKKQLLWICFTATFFVASQGRAQIPSPSPAIQSNANTVRHTVVFKLKASLDSVETVNFFNAAKKLANIRGVQNFECLKEISMKNKFDYGLSMEFESRQLYDQYLSHPQHVSFVQAYWLKDVEDFLEIDYEPLKP